MRWKELLIQGPTASWKLGPTSAVLPVRHLTYTEPEESALAPTGSPEQEAQRSDLALGAVKQEIERVKSVTTGQAGAEQAAIFDAHVLLLSDKAFLGRAEERIRSSRVNAEWAVKKIAEELDERFSHIDDNYLKERSEDLSDVSRHLLRSLQGIAFRRAPLSDRGQRRGGHPHQTACLGNPRGNEFFTHVDHDDPALLVDMR